MSDNVIISKCLGCGNITAAALICHDSDPKDIGRLIIATVVDGKAAMIVDGPVSVSACRCAKELAGAQLLALREKIANLERQVSNERYMRKRAESGEPTERIRDLVRTAELLGDTLTVDQLRDAIEGHTRALGAMQ